MAAVFVLFANPFEPGVDTVTVTRGDNRAMSDESQIIVPPSFIALFMAPGRTRPNAPRDEIAARYELCEDLATMLTDHASAKLWELGVTQADVLERIHRGLLTGDATVTPPEAQWVIQRLAELLDWDAPPFDSRSAT